MLHKEIIYISKYTYYVDLTQVFGVHVVHQTIQILFSINFSLINFVYNDINLTYNTIFHVETTFRTRKSDSSMLLIEPCECLLSERT